MPKNTTKRAAGSHRLLTEAQSQEMKEILWRLEGIATELEKTSQETPEPNWEQIAFWAGKEAGLRAKADKALCGLLLVAKRYKRLLSARTFSVSVITSIVGPEVDEKSMDFKKEVWTLDNGEPIPETAWYATIHYHRDQPSSEPRSTMLSLGEPATAAILKERKKSALSDKALDLILKELESRGLTKADEPPLLYIGWPDFLNLVVICRLIDEVAKFRPDLLEKLKKVELGKPMRLQSPALSDDLESKQYANAHTKCQQIFSAIAKLKKADNNQLQWIFPGQGEEEEPMLVCPDYSDLYEKYPKFKGLSVGYDWLVYSACFKGWLKAQREKAAQGLSQDGSAVISYEDIYHYMGRRGNPNPSQLKEVRDSVDKMARAMFHFVYKYPDKEHPGHISVFKGDEPLIHREAYEKYNEKGDITISKLKLIAPPVIFRLYQQIKLLKPFPVSLISVPTGSGGRVSARELDIKMYLVNRITNMKAKNPATSNKILTDTLCEYIGKNTKAKLEKLKSQYGPSDSKTKTWYAERQQIKLQVRNILDNWKAQGWISDWTEEGAGEEHGYIITPATKAKKKAKK